MVIVITGILFGIIGLIMKNSIDAYFFVNSREVTLSDGRLAINRMVREIRQIRDPSDITTMTATELQFTDIDDNVINFRQNGTDLERNGNILAEDLQASGGLIFTYLNAAGSTTTSAADVRTIEVQLTIENLTGGIIIKSEGRLRNT
jgi:hypothetical protein